jgi:hypothetical protein
LGVCAQPATPAFIGKAMLTSDGLIMCDFREGSGLGHYGALAGDLRHLLNSLKGVADHCGLLTVERVILANTMIAWIPLGQCYRPLAHSMIRNACMGEPYSP